jgi:hypothetical protein
LDRVLRASQKKSSAQSRCAAWSSKASPVAVVVRRRVPRHAGAPVRVPDQRRLVAYHELLERDRVVGAPTEELTVVSNAHRW